MAIKESTVKAVFTNLIFVIGIILTIIGFIQGTSTAVKLIVFDEYPLNSYEETRCELTAAYPKLEDDPEVTIKNSEIQKTNCTEGLERDRKLKLVEDITASVSFFLAGLFLAVSFRRFIFGKARKSK